MRRLLLDIAVGVALFAILVAVVFFTSGTAAQYVYGAF